MYRNRGVDVALLHLDDQDDMRRLTTSASDLRRWYQDDRLTIEQIADRLGCGATTVARRFRAANIARRRRGPAPGNGSDRRRIPRDELWLPEIAYAVGLITTDGNLSRDGRHLAVVSADRDLLDVLKRCLVVDNRIGDKFNRGRPCYRLQWSDRTLYDELVRIGLHPAKSLTLGELAIPDACFADFFRGCIDGDGSIITYTDRYHASKNSRYVYERLYVVLSSASRPFLDWVRRVIQRIIGARGSITSSTRPDRRHPVFRLRYAKRESLYVLRWMYYSPSVACLPRKRAIADAFLSACDRGIL